MYIVRRCKFSVAAVISTRRIYSTARCSGGLAMASYGKGLRAATRPGGVKVVLIQRSMDHRWWSTYTSWVGRQCGLQHLLINTDACFDPCVSQGSSRTVRNRPVLGRVIRRADTAAAFTRKNWLCLDVGPALFSTVKFCRRRLKRSSTFLQKNALALSFCSNQCKILEMTLCIAGRRRGNAIIPIGNNGKQHVI